MLPIRTIMIGKGSLTTNSIRDYIGKVDWLQLVGIFSHVVEATQFLRQNRADVVFLDVDISIPDASGLLGLMDRLPMAIITVAYGERALKGLGPEVVDHLVEPISFPRFLEAVGRATNMGHATAISDNRPSVLVKLGKKRLHRIYVDEILVIESLRDYIRIKTTSARYIVRRTLGGFTDELPTDKFVRIHRSFTVAIDKIESMKGNGIEVCGIRYTIGRSYLKAAKKRILGR